MAAKVSKEDTTRKYGDRWIWGIYITLVIFSIIESYSAASREVAKLGVYMPVIKQCAILGVGALIMWALSRFDYNRPLVMVTIIHALAVVTVVSLVYVMFFGQDINGAQRSIQLPGFTFQPSELAKLSIVTALAFIYSRNQRNMDVSWLGIIESVVVIAIFAGFLIQSGLTNTLLVMCISATMMLIGGTQWKKIFILLIMFAVIALVALGVKSHNEEKDQVLSNAVAQTEMVVADSVALGGNGDDGKSGLRREGTWQSRINAWLDRDNLVYKEITNKNQQEMFSRIAQAHGGWIGVGIGNSRECSRLPLAFSDYIFSIIVEELGLVGGIILMLIYLSLLGRALKIVRLKSHRTLPSLLLIGLACMIVFQALFHMAINTGVFPVSGQPLPLISMGGTSILVTSMAFGIMLSVSRTLVNNDSKVKSKAQIEREEQSARERVKKSLENEWK